MYKERERALRAFRSGRMPIMVATDVAARGLDVPHVSHVINYDLPKGIDSYVHRIGRTGRAGKAGLATAFFSDANQPLAKALAECMDETKQEVPDWLRDYANMASAYSGKGVLRTGGVRFGSRDYRKGSTSGSQYSTPYGDKNLSRDNYDYQSDSSNRAGYSYDYQRYGGALGGSGADGENYESLRYRAYCAVGDADGLQRYGANAGKDDSINGVSYELQQADLGNVQIIPTGWN